MVERVALSEVDPAQVRDRPVEEVYKKVSQLEHILLRPDTYIGSADRAPSGQPLWVATPPGDALELREISYAPGLYKIFDEILVNAADHKQRDSTMDTLKVDIDVENNRISVFNNGFGIPIEIHAKENVYVPELIFGHLLTSSNYNDSEKKVVGGRNGYGAKLANIFSTEFVVETASSRSGKKYKQIFRNNMGDKDKPQLKSVTKKEDWTRISFCPDLAKFGMNSLDPDIVALMKKRVMDIAGCNPKVKVYLDGIRLPFRSFRDYVQLYQDDQAKELIHERCSDRWEVVVSVSEGQFSNTSFVNSIWTIKGGTHVNHVADSIISKLTEHIAKKNKGVKVKPFQIKSQLSIFVNCLVENPAFDSQTKETLTSKPSTFGSKWNPSDDMVKKIISKSGVIESVLAFAKFKQSTELKKTDGGKKERVLGIPKLDDANMAGTRKASQCTLILTEGDSAKALAVSGLSVVGRDYYGVFPLRGKLLNVRDANHKQIMDNPEISNLKKILGLQQGKTYDATSIKALRYGHVVIMTDQDHDGSHIKGLLINFVDHFWPSLLKVPGFLQEFITPIVKCSRGKTSRSFYTLPEYKSWFDAQPNNAKGWNIKYYKGLGTSTAAEAKEYFSDLDEHLLPFHFEGEQDADMIKLAFAKAKVSDRKDWLLGHEPGTFFDHKKDRLNFSNFVNKELILFSIADNERSIPSVMDGFKPSQRKVMFGCFKRNLKNEIKVAQLAGYISEHAAYHHGEQALMGTIMGLAQNFVGSNNINLLYPSGQFGTRLAGGKDAASARYIFTKLTSSCRYIFPEADDPVLHYLEDDGMSIEPKHYCPIIPMVLVNGAEGIGTGWATSVPCYNPTDVIENVRRMIKGLPCLPMKPWYRGFSGAIIPVDGKMSSDIHGKVYRDDGSMYGDSDSVTVRVMELPVGTWTTPYKEFLENCITNAEGTKALASGCIKDFDDRSTEDSVDFNIKLNRAAAEKHKDSVGLYKLLKLTSSVATSNMVLFDAEGKIRKYETTEEIMQDFFDIRRVKYVERKQHILKVFEREVAILQNKVRFILLVIEGKLVVAKRKKNEIIADLTKRGFQEFPKKVSDEDGESTSTSSGFDYLLSMALWSLTAERVAALIAERDGKENEAEIMRHTAPDDLWLRDLDAFEANLSEEAAKQSKVESAPKKKIPQKGKKKIEKDAEPPLEEHLMPHPAGRVIVAKGTRRPKAVVVKPAPKKQLRPKTVVMSDSEDEQEDIVLDDESRLSSPEISEVVVREATPDEDSDLETSLTARLAQRMTISGEMAKPEAVKKPPPNKSKRVRAPKAKSIVDDDKDDVIIIVSPETKTPKPKRLRNVAKQVKPQRVADLFDYDEESPLPEPEPVRPRQRRAAPKIVYDESDDEASNPSDYAPDDSDDSDFQ